MLIVGSSPIPCTTYLISMSNNGAKLKLGDEVDFEGDVIRKVSDIVWNKEEQKYYYWFEPTLGHDIPEDEL